MNTSNLKTNSLLSAIKQRYNLDKIAIFGSVARGKDDESSDLDIAAEFKSIDLFELAGLKEELEKEFHRRVDIVCIHKNMNPYLKKRIEKEAIYV